VTVLVVIVKINKINKMEELNTFRKYVTEGDVNEVKMSDEDVKNAYEEAYANETGKRLRTRSFDYDKVTKKTVRKEVIIIKNLTSDGEELGDVTLVNSGDGYNIGY